LKSHCWQANNDLPAAMALAIYLKFDRFVVFGSESFL
jgi:hypothetical protein